MRFCEWVHKGISDAQGEIFFGADENFATLLFTGFFKLIYYNYWSKELWMYSGES